MCENQTVCSSVNGSLDKYNGNVKNNQTTLQTHAGSTKCI